MSMKPFKCAAQTKTVSELLGLSSTCKMRAPHKFMLEKYNTTSGMKASDKLSMIEFDMDAQLS